MQNPLLLADTTTAIGVLSALVVGALIGLTIDTPVIKKHLTP